MATRSAKIDQKADLIWAIADDGFIEDTYSHLYR